MTRAGKSDYIAALIATVLLLAVNITYVSWSTGFVHPASRVLETDHYRYLEMARGPENYAGSRLAHEPPYCWRLLVPFLAFAVSQLGPGIDPAFFLLTSLFLGGFLFVFYLYLRQAGLGTGYSLIGLTLVALTPGAVRWYGYQYWMTDPAGLFLVTLSFYLIRSRRTTELLAVAVIAVTVRESYLAVLIYYFLYLLKRRGWRAAGRESWPVLLVPAVLLLLIRYYIIPSADYDIAAVSRSVLAFRAENFWPGQVYLLTIGSFGVIFPLLLLFPARPAAKFRGHYDKLAYLVIVYASLIAGYNTDRLLVYALPVLVVPALRNLKRLIDRTGFPAAVVVIPVLLLQVCFYVSTRFYGIPAVSIFQPVRLPVVVSLSLFWVSALGTIYIRRARGG